MTRNYTNKQMGDACEFLVAAELTLAGIPALKVPDLWPGYDVIAQPRDGGTLQRLSVKSRTFKRGAAFVEYLDSDAFDWLAIVILPQSGETRRRIFIVPRAIADLKARRNNPKSKTANQRYWRIDQIAKEFQDFEDNFTLKSTLSGQSTVT
jgi:hypothetical protein